MGPLPRYTGEIAREADGGARAMRSNKTRTMYKCFPALIFTFLLFDLGMVLAQENKIPESRLLTFQEKRNPTFQVSAQGRLIRGLMFEATGPAVADEIFITPQGSLDDELCVDIWTKDGSYDASLVYDVSGLAGDTLTLGYPTHEAAFLDQYAPSELALLTTTSEDCDGDMPQYHVAAGWAGAETAENLWILVNAGADRIRLVHDGAGSALKARRCRKHPTAVAGRIFDTVCTISLEDFTASSVLYVESVSSDGSAERDRVLFPDDR